MKKGTLAIVEFEKFYKRELRIPTCDEFIQLGYSKASYYRVRNIFYQILQEEEMIGGGDFNVRQRI